MQIKPLERVKALYVFSFTFLFIVPAVGLVGPKVDAFASRSFISPFTVVSGLRPTQ